MALARVGSHWLHPDRNLHDRPSFSVELLYARGAADGSGWGWADVAARAAMVRSKGAQVALRVDWKQRQVLPGMNDEAGAYDYCSAVQQAAAQFSPDYLICGNEPNLHSEVTTSGEIQPWWVARLVFGHTLPSSRTDCAYQFARTARPNVIVLAPPVAPYCPDSAGDPSGCTPPDGRPVLAPWESYAYDLARSCYVHNGHVPSIGEVRFGAHTYGRVGADGSANHAASEPWYDVREPTYGAQFGSRWFQDMLYLCRQGMLNSPYADDLYPGGVLISEANTLTDAYPVTNYPAGWWHTLAAYVKQFPNVLGLAAFVDQDYGSGWGNTAMTVPNGCLPQWNADHDALLARGW